jgi:hypothetical protein
MFNESQKVTGYPIKANLQPTKAEAITASATVYAPSIVFVGTGGNVTVTTADGDTGVVFKNLASGSTLPVLVTAVTAATAADLVLIR